MSAPRRSILAIATLAAALPVLALGLEPMSLSLAPLGQGTTATLRLSNEGEARVAVTVSMLTRSVDADGREVNADAGALFLVFPERLILAPGESKPFKIQWRGDASPARELSFRLVASQSPVDFQGKAATGLRILFKYVASIYVTPAGASQRLEVAAARGALGPDGKPGLELTLENRGGRHVLPVSSSLSVAGGWNEATIAGVEGEPGPLDGYNFLPGMPRRLFVAWGAAEPGREYDARLTFTPEY